MTLSVSGNVAVSVSLTLSNPQNLSSGTKKFSKNYLQSYSNGTGNDQVNSEWDDERTLALSTSESLDLSGSLLDQFGNKIAFSKIKEILIFAADANPGNLEVGGAASNGFLLFKDATDIAVIEPGGLFYQRWPNGGRTVTAATGDLLKINNTSSAGSASYDIIVVGLATLTPAS